MPMLKVSRGGRGGLTVFKGVLDLSFFWERTLDEDVVVSRRRFDIDIRGADVGIVLEGLLDLRREADARGEGGVEISFVVGGRLLGRIQHRL